jgi:hypothetical protein
MPATLSSTSFLADNLRLTLGLAEVLAHAIPADKFAFLPQPNMNHPAWCYGHLSLYPARICRFLGRDEIADPDDHITELFKAGSTPVSDPALYPSKDGVLALFNDAHAQMLEILPSITEEDLAKPTPNERYAQRMPHVGNAMHFMLSNHIMFHLGQVSTWRRCIGLPSAT